MRRVFIEGLVRLLMLRGARARVMLRKWWVLIFRKRKVVYNM
jgi:hypothetical protein